MEQYNLSEIIGNNIHRLCIIGNDNYEKVITYLLNTGLENVFGSYIFDKKNLEFVTSQDRDGFINLYVESIYRKPIDITILRMNDMLVISAIDDEKLIMSLEVHPHELKSYSAYELEGHAIEEERKVDFTNGDANSFTITKTEDGEKVYEGTFNPILASRGDNEYFDFKYKINGEENEEKSASFLKRLVDSLTDKSLVAVSTSRDIHSLSDYASSIFNSLSEKLEQLRVKKDVKVRKRVPVKKQEV